MSDMRRRPGSLPVAVAGLVVSLLPGLAAFLPGVARVVWNLGDPIQRTYLTVPRVALLIFLLAVVLAPFVGAVACLVLAHRRGLSWSSAVWVASLDALGLGMFAVYAVSMTGGGF